MKLDGCTDLFRRRLWGRVSRSASPAFFLLVVFTLHLLWSWTEIYLRDNSRIFNLDIFYRILPSIYLIMTGALVLLYIGQHLKRAGKEPLWLQHVSANYYSFCLVWAGYLTGSLSMAAGVVLMGAPLLGFILLDRRAVLLAFANAAILLFAVNVASAYGLIPYSPLLLSPAAQGSAVSWTNAQLLMAAPHLIFNIILAAYALGRWRLGEEKSRKFSLSDPLTRLLNRRGILHKLEKELALATRHQHPLTVALFDLDHFKQINDRWGHPVGDKVLQACAEAINEEIRASDTLGRFGGEEFLLVLTDTNAVQARQILERCRQRLQSLEITTEKGEPIPVSASFGFCHPSTLSGVTRDNLINTADQALYQAKDAGRNCIRSGDIRHRETQAPPPPAPTWQWHDLLKMANWRPFLYSILGWSPVDKAILVTGLTTFIAINAVIVLTFLQSLDNVEELGSVAVGEAGRQIALAMTVLLLIMVATGFYLRRRWPASRLYQACALHSFGLSLVTIGYFVGILYIPTGIMLLCSPIVGFMLFDRRLVLEVFFVSLGAVISLAYLSAYDVIPYAPLLHHHLVYWQVNFPALTFGFYFFITLSLGIVMVLVDHILGSWRQRRAAYKQAAKIDALTGVMNRHSIMQELDAAISHTQRHKQGVAVVLLDLDYFKHINDNLGHPAGDAVLVHAAKKLAGNLRTEDSIGRFGGEEFLLILQHLNQEQAEKLAERCRRSLGVVVYDDDDAPIPVSASFGVAFYRGIGTLDAGQLLKAADDALYQAKNQGRNRVIVADLLPLSA